MPRPLLPGEVAPQVTERLYRGKASLHTTSQSRLRLDSSPGRGAKASARQPAQLGNAQAGLQSTVDGRGQQGGPVGDDAVQLARGHHKVAALLGLHQGRDACRYDRHPQPGCVQMAAVAGLGREQPGVRELQGPARKSRGCPRRAGQRGGSPAPVPRPAAANSARWQPTRPVPLPPPAGCPAPGRHAAPS